MTSNCCTLYSVSLISTHTLTWSVTFCIIDKTIRFVKFQLTRSRGAWHDCFDLKCSLMLFQLTRSRGAWRKNLCSVRAGNKFQLTRSRGAWLNEHYKIMVKDYHFNSHAHVERDPFNVALKNSATHFNSHAHVERDREKIKKIAPVDISTHTLTWSVT